MDLIKEIEGVTNGIVGGFRGELSNIRANRPTPKLVEGIKVDCYNQQLTVMQLGSIHVVPPREIVITLWDQEAVLPTAKAIETSGLGLTSNVDGNTIRIFLPALSDERREELGRLVKSIAEQSRIRIRGLRDEYNKKVESDFKAKNITEDQKFNLKKQIQKVVDGANEQIELLVAQKIKELHE